MTRRVQIRRWKVSQVGVLGEGSVEVGPLGPGVNVISGPNECGKSTMVEALRVALFERSAFRGRAVKELHPRGLNVTPAVEVELDVDGVRYRLEKRLKGQAFARLYVGDDPVPLENDRADERVRQLLGAREGNKQGTSEDDMGLWGLLWVKQDEFAAKEPAERLGAPVKADLADAFQQQVGDALGGGEGVRLREAIEARFLTHYTLKRDQPTGELAALEKKLAALDDALRGSQQALQEIERAGDEIQRAEREIEGIDEARGRWQADLDAVAAQVAAAERAEGESLAAQEVLRAEGALRDAAEGALRQREARATRAREAQAAVAAHAPVRDARRAERDALREERDRAALTLRGSTEARDGLRAEVDALTLRKERAELHHTVLRLEVDLRDARAERRRADEAAAQLAALPERGRVQRALALQRERDELAAVIARTALRVEHEDVVTPVSRRARVDLGALGAVEIDPPRVGFLQCHARWRASVDALQLALARAGAASVAELRGRREGRAQLESQRAPHLDALKHLCPKGIEVLSAAVEQLRVEDRTFADRLADARALDEQRLRHAAALDGLRPDPALTERARALAVRVAVQREELERAAVKVTVRPLTPVRVQFGETDTPRLLTAGSALVRSVPRAVTVVIDERVEVRIDPGAGPDPSASLDASEAELRALWSTLGVADLDALTLRLHASDEAQRALDGVLGELRSTAPEGLIALETQRAKHRERLRLAEQQLAEARAASLALGSLPEPPEAVDDAQWSRIDALDQARLREELDARRHAGRVLRAEGPIASVWPAGTDLLGDRPEADGVRVVLGECDPHALSLCEARLHDERAQLPTDDLHALQALVAQRDPLESVRAGALDALQRLAPSGLDALEAELAARRARLGPTDPTPPEDPAPLQRRCEDQRRVLFDESQRVQRDAEVLERRSADLVEVEHRLGVAEREHAEREGQVRTAEGVLVDERALHPDEALTEAYRRAQARVDQATRAWEVAQRRAMEADLARRREEAAHYARELEACEARLDAAWEAQHRREGELREMQRQGRFDQCEDWRDEREQVLERLARVRADAEAVSLLWRLTQEEYGAAHERLLTPVYQAAQPLLRELWPDARLTLDHESLKVRSVERGSAAESFGDLSGGAREQLAVIVRVAMARVLAKDHASMPLILDDILGWTDDERLRRMLRVIELAARDMQVILLTCHPSRFARFVNATRWDLPALKR
jgi:DNA repair exonuclease SbcCD ATPase subunit